MSTTGILHHATTCVPVGAEGTAVTCTSGGVRRELVSNESRLLDLLAAGRSRDGRLEERTIAKCACKAQMRSCGRSRHLCAVLTSAGSQCRDGGEGRRREDEESMTSSQSRCREEGVLSHSEHVSLGELSL